MIDPIESANEAAACAQMEYDQRNAKQGQPLGHAFSDLSHLPAEVVKEVPTVLGQQFAQQRSMNEVRHEQA